MPGPEVSRGRKQDSDPWCHHVGDEWLAANPVEIPGLPDTLKACLLPVTTSAETQNTSAHILALPAELLDHILTFLDKRDLIAAAGTSRMLRCHAQPLFRMYAGQDISWLWEIYESDGCPTSPDWPATWDPCNPPGLDTPDVPCATDKEEQEICNQITMEYPELANIENVIRTLNFLRREAILSSYRAKIDWSMREWEIFRANVTDWITRPPADHSTSKGAVDWVRLWHTFHPNTTQIAGIRNRARIWKECQRIVGHAITLRKHGAWEAKQKIVREVISYNRAEWWELEKQAMQEDSHRGFLRKRPWQ